MKTPKIMLIIFVSMLSVGSATGANFTLSDDGLMALDWVMGNRTAILLEKTNVPGLGVRFVIKYQGNEPQDQGFRYVSHEDYGGGLLTGIDVSMYDYYQLKFTLLSIYSSTNPDPGAVLGVGALIGPYDDHSSAYDPEGLDFDPGPDYGTTAISSTPVRLDNTPSLLGFVAYLPWLDQWSPSGTVVTILVEAVPGAVAIPDLHKIYYVDVDMGIVGDGSSWADAYNDLQDALAIAESGDEIRVAQGIYKPTGYVPPPPPPPPPPGGDINGQEAELTAGDRTATFQLINGVAIKGGYAGFGEPNADARDIKLYETILSGDIAGDDGPDFANNSENSYHVVTSHYADENTVLDGFTIIGGNADGERWLPDSFGGAIYSYRSSPVIRNCTFHLNVAGYFGGAMYIHGGRPTLLNCTFIDNKGDFGGAMNIYNTEAVLRNCVFKGNVSVYEHGRSGAIHNILASPIIINCLFRMNSARYGGAITNVDSKPVFINCLFNANLASSVGIFGKGGALANWRSSPILTDCTISGNSAISGGGIYNKESSATLTNCILWGNGPNEIFNDALSSTTVTYSDVQGGWPGEGNIDVDPCFVEPEYFGPIAYWKFDEASGTTAYDSAGFNHGTVYGAQWTSGQVDSALDFDGMNDYVDIPYDSSLDIDASEGITLSVWIKLNSYPGTLNQGPIFGLYDSTGAGTKNYLSIMKSNYGNVISWDQWPKTSYGWIESIKPDLDTWYHVTVVEDSSYRAIYINGSLDASDNTPESYEGNPPDTIRIGCRADDWAPFYFDGTIDEVVVYNIVLSADDIQQHYLSGLNGQAYPPVRDYHLLPGSPCINAGDPNYVPEPNETDLDGNPRVIGGRIDMGAYELQNTSPVANAGPDQVVECACNTGEGTKVTLDGNGSYDADGDPLTFTWSGSFVGSPAQGAAPTVTLEDGCPDNYVITLVVNDGIDDSEPNDVVITVVDTTPPDFELSVNPTMLWPPDHKMYEITPRWTVSDKCDATPDVMLVSIAMSEADNIPGGGNTSDDIQIGEDGSIYLRAERSGTTDDRIYTITYQAVDDSGNAAVRSTIVSIPHDFKVLARIAARWLWTNPAGRIPEDLNGDGIVNLADFARFAENWIK
ncbi:MAG: hypothetical protein FVQ85_05055 [Planctomycetes bacterium]|nr:hypothetical protein [Planctomycetota bacterium]